MSALPDFNDYAAILASRAIGETDDSARRYLRREPRNEVEAAHLIHEEHREADEWMRSIDAASFPACRSATSACRGGRRLCPSPQACRRPEAAAPRVPSTLLRIVVALGLGAALGLTLFWRH